MVDMLRVAAIAAALTIAAASAARADDPPLPAFPSYTADDLNGRVVTLPQDLPGDPTLVFVAFKRRQQSDINQWIDLLQLQDPETPIAWVELPVVGAFNRLFKGYIDNGMRSGITTFENRARTITIYESRRGFIRALNLPDTDRIYIIIADRAGRVSLIVDGLPTPEKRAQVLAALGVDPAAMGE